MARTTNTTNKAVAAAKAAKAAAKTTGTEEGGKEGDTSDSTTSSGPVKSVPKAADKKKVKVTAKRISDVLITCGSKHGSYVDICELRQNVIVTYMTKQQNNHNEEPFTKYWKEAVQEGLEDRSNGAKTENGGMVSKLGIVMMCPRRGIDGQLMKQSKSK